MARLPLLSALCRLHKTHQLPVLAALAFAALMDMSVMAHDYQLLHRFKITTPGNFPPAVFFSYRASAYARTNTCIDAPAPNLGTDPIGLGQWIAARSANAPASTAQSQAIANITALGNGLVIGTIEVIGDANPSIAGCPPPNPPRGLGWARASSAARITVRGQKIDRNGNIRYSGGWVFTPLISRGTERGIIRDPIVARLIDYTTGVTTTWTLMSFMISASDGQIAWNSNVLSSTSANMTLDFKIDSPVTVQQGRLRLAVVGGVVTERIRSGIFASLAVPAVGTGGAFSASLPELSLDYNLGGDATHNLVPEFDFENGGETDKAANGRDTFACLITDIGTGYTGSNVSALPTGDTIFGYGVKTDQAWIADDFTVPSGSSWALDSLVVPLYQTNAAPNAPLTAAYVQVWRGQPGAGGVPIVGDMVTNRLIDTQFTDMYRVASDPTNSNRAIRDAMIDMSWAPALPSGHYWVVFGAEGDASLSGPWAPPGVWASSSDNALQFNVQTGEWSTLFESGSQRRLSFPFRLFGALQDSCPADIAPAASGGNGVVDVNDLLMVISNWNATGGPADITQDGIVNVNDMLAVIGGWGNCPVFTGACCLPNGQCTIQTEMVCLSLVGVYRGDNVSCGSMNCPVMPPNDRCPGAFTVFTGYNSWNNTNAGTDGPPSCAAATRDVWFNYTATCTGNLTIDTLGTPSPFIDTVLEVFSGFGCNPIGTVLACNDDIQPGSNRLSSVTLPVFAGQPLKIRCASWGSDPTNQGQAYLRIYCSP